MKITGKELLELIHHINTSISPTNIIHRGDINCDEEYNVNFKINKIVYPKGSNLPSICLFPEEIDGVKKYLDFKVKSARFRSDLTNLLDSDLSSEGK